MNQTRPARKLGFGIVFLLCMFLASTPLAKAQSPVIGVNVRAQASLSVDQQDAILDQISAANIHFIRAGITADEKGINFARRAQAHGIKILMLVQLQYAPGAPSKPYPNEYHTYGGHPLSSTDTYVFRKYFQDTVDKLEAAGVAVGGFELGNEFNAAPFNAEFSFPAENPNQPRQFSLDDLHRDPEGRQIAQGYLQYLKLLAVLKDVRDHSKLNKHSPIISGGLVCDEVPEGPRGKGKKLDMASEHATLEFMRENGLDKLVDAYGIHTYPWDSDAGTAKGAQGRRARLAKYVLDECRPEGSSSGKPCWITEWAFPNDKTSSCPLPDSPHAAHQLDLIREERDDFKPYVDQRKLTGLFYYAWLDQEYGVYRCNRLTAYGRAALAPF